MRPALSPDKHPIEITAHGGAGKGAREGNAAGPEDLAPVIPIWSKG